MDSIDLRAVVEVGDGRGFVVEVDFDRYIITAAHCVPDLLQRPSFLGAEDRTCVSLLGPIGGPKTVWAECIFVDPMGDIAVLCSPDDQSLFQQAKRYQKLVYQECANEVTPFAIADAPAEGDASLLSLDLRWFSCKVERINDGPIWISDAADNILGGMSGSPIVAPDGSAIGIVCSASSTDNEETFTQGGPNAAITRNLPAWLFRKLAKNPAFKAVAL